MCNTMSNMYGINLSMRGTFHRVFWWYRHTCAPDLLTALLLTALIAAPLYYGVYLAMLNWFVVPELRGE